jgi:hypothetical protein
MKMTTAKRMIALFLALMLCLAFTACSSEDSSLTDDSVDESDMVYATAGGSVTLPEGFALPENNNSMKTELVENTLVGAFNYTNYRTTGYFTTNGEMTVTVQATLETGGINTKWTDATFSLWKQGAGTTVYQGTVHFTADGSPYSYTFTGLEPGALYRIAFTYSDVPKYKLTGTFNITGVTGETTEELTTA